MSSDLLDEVHGALGAFVVFPSVEAHDAVVLFTAATHAQVCWEHATRLVIKSPMKRCGKSRLEEVLAELCHRPLRTANASVAALVRSIDAGDPPTLILDEADTVFSSRRGEQTESAQDLRGILNAGHARGVPYLRWNMTNRQLEECPTFAMAVIAGIGNLPDTIEDRSVIVSMRRRANGEQVTPFRRRQVPSLRELRIRLAAWVDDSYSVLDAAEPDLPVEDRAADVWEPLVAIADQAGGDWPKRARHACQTLTWAADVDTTEGEQLLVDLAGIFHDHEQLSTSAILDELHRLDESPWRDWHDGRPLDARGLARLLRPFGVRSKNVRVGMTVPKGYDRADLVEPWARYLRTPPLQALQPLQDSESDDTLDLACSGYVADSDSIERYTSEQGRNGHVADVAEVAEVYVDGRPLDELF